jgi:hypothetical protein
MPFSDEVIQQAWHIAGGRCQCRCSSHAHRGLCDKQLCVQDHGREAPVGWEAHHFVPEAQGGGDSLFNCRVYCWRCHKASF